MHAAPNFVVVPKDIVYVGIGDNIILNCQVRNRSLSEDSVLCRSCGKADLIRSAEESFW